MRLSPFAGIVLTAGELRELVGQYLTDETPDDSMLEVARLTGDGQAVVRLQGTRALHPLSKPSSSRVR